VIDRRLVVQFEAVVAQAPIVADAPDSIDDQGIEADALQLNRSRNAGMAATDNENVRLAIVEGDLGLPLVEPVRTGEITRMGYWRIALRSRVADPVEVEGCRNRPGEGRSVRRADQPDGSDAGSVDRIKANDRFDDLLAGDDRPAGDECRGVHPELAGVHFRGATAQFVAEYRVSANSRELPGNPEQIPPMAVGQEQFGQGLVVSGRQREAKGANPLLRGFFGRRRQFFQHQDASPIYYRRFLCA
jgi:hypothetical protein